MCWAEKCCYFIPANLGCVFVGIFSFILSTFILVSSIVFLSMETKENAEQLVVQKTHGAHVLGLYLNESSVHIVFSIAIIAALLWMLFSVLLIFGVVKNNPSCVVSFFAFGIVVTILGQLSALLLLLHHRWIMALIIFICFCIYIHFLVVVHTVYELMQSGKNFRLNQRQEDEDPLADCFDTNIDTI